MSLGEMLSNQKVRVLASAVLTTGSLYGARLASDGLANGLRLDQEVVRTREESGAGGAFRTIDQIIETCQIPKLSENDGGVPIMVDWEERYKLAVSCCDPKTQDRAVRAHSKINNWQKQYREEFSQDYNTYGVRAFSSGVLATLSAMGVVGLAFVNSGRRT